jgi:hypothetical protein
VTRVTPGTHVCSSPAAVLDHMQFSLTYLDTPEQPCTSVTQGVDIREATVIRTSDQQCSGHRLRTHVRSHYCRLTHDRGHGWLAKSQHRQQSMQNRAVGFEAQPHVTCPWLKARHEHHAMRAAGSQWLPPPTMPWTALSTQTLITRCVRCRLADQVTTHFEPNHDPPC